MIRVLVDVDGVVADMHVPLLARYNRDYDDTLTVEAIRDWTISNFVKPECGIKVNNYFEDPTLYDDCPMVEGAHSGVWMLRKMGFEVDFLTSNTGPEMLRAKSSWLIRNGFVADPTDPLDCCFFVNKKGRVNGNYLIDDRPKNIEDFGGNGILFIRPWNAKYISYWRAGSWREVVRTFMMRYPTHALSVGKEIVSYL